MPNTPCIAINKGYEDKGRTYIVQWVSHDKWMGALKFEKNNKISTFDLWKKNNHDSKKIGSAISFLYDLVGGIEKRNIDAGYVTNPYTNGSIGYSYFNQLTTLLNGI